MKKYILFIIVVALLSVSFVAAMNKADLIEAINSKSHNGVVVHVPSHVPELAPGVFFLGTTTDVDGSVVEGYAVIDYKDHNAKPGTVCGNDICEPGEKKSCSQDCGSGSGGDTTSSCYAFTKEVKWKTQEDYLVDATNNEGLSEATIKTIIADAISEWEDAAGDSSIMGSEVAGIVDRESIIGNDGVYSNSDPTLNGKNEYLFADIEGSNAIAVTITWGIFSGPPSNRKIVETDQVYDQETFDWSLTGEASKMDFENIAQHEIGHGFGMNHPSSECTEETMFASASNGEIKKRDLFDGDKTGIAKLY